MLWLPPGGGPGGGAAARGGRAGQGRLGRETNARAGGLCRRFALHSFASQGEMLHISVQQSKNFSTAQRLRPVRSFREI